MPIVVILVLICTLQNSRNTWLERGKIFSSPELKAMVCYHRPFTFSNKDIFNSVIKFHVKHHQPEERAA